MNNKKQTKKKNYTLDDLEKAQKSGQVFDAMIKEVDESFNLHGFFANGIECIIPREEVSSIVGDDGLVEERLCTNKKDKTIFTFTIGFNFFFVYSPVSLS